MKSYTVYFELFGRKMKTTVEAESAIKAKELIKSKIIFHDVEVKPDMYRKIDDIFGYAFNDGIFGDIFGKNFK